MKQVTKSFKYKGQTFKHGDYVTCVLSCTIITDARISISDNNSIYICQNEKCGAGTKEQFGYAYAWIIGYELSVHYIAEDRRIRHATDTYEIY